MPVHPLRTSPEIRQRAKELRKQMTPAEDALWKRLRNRQLCGLKFRRQHPIGPYIADFYCVECRLMIEVDGSIHLAQAESDHQRTILLADYNDRVLRIKNDEILTNPEGVIAKILAACQSADIPLSTNVERG
jgi:very-short-patch-repair endonuclease